MPDKDALDLAMIAARPSDYEPAIVTARARVRAALLGRTEPLPSIGRFVVLDRIGRGGMGTVYAASDPKLDRKVALKIVRADHEQARERVLREARAQAQLAHPNVVAVHDTGAHGELVFIAMELVTGSDLRKWLRMEPRSWREVSEVFLGAARGLAAAHDRSLVHGDFKPENLLVSRDGRAQVADFGLARFIDTPGEPSTAWVVEPNDLLPELTHARGGTPAYMAPELVGGAHPTAASDQFAWCTSLYEGLYGRRPFRGGTVEPHAVRELRVPAKGTDGRIPGWLRELLERGLAFDPSRRFSSMGELTSRLERGLGARRRHAFIASLGVAASAIAASLAVVAWSSTDADLCRGGPGRLTKVWNPERADAVKRMFTETGSPAAADAFRVVAQRLDAYGGAWTGMYEQSCEATHVRGDQSSELLDLRTQCLERRLDAVDALVNQWTTGHVAVERAARAADDLPSVAACADVPALREPLPPPQDPARRARISELQRRIARVFALRQSGKLDEAVVEARAIVAEASTLDYPRLHGESLVALGEAQREAVDRSSAATFEAAMDAASRARDEKTLIDAALGFVASKAVEEKPDEVLALNSLLRPLLHRREAPELWARYFMSVGAALDVKADYTGALAAYDQSLTALQTLPPSGAATRTNIEIAATLMHAARPDEALAVLTKLEAQQEGTSGAYLPDRADLLALKGAVLGQLGRREDQEKTLRSALAMAETTYGPSTAAVGIVLINLGDCVWASGRSQESLTHLERALKIFDRPGHRIDTARTLNSLGNALASLGELQRAQAAYERAIEMYIDTVGPDDRRVATSINGLANALRGQDKHDDARIQFERALAMYEKALGPTHPAVAVALSNIGEMDLLAGRPAAAIERCERALRIDEEKRGKDHPDVAYDLMCLGEAHLALGQSSQAVSPLERAVALRDAQPGDVFDHGKAVFALARALGSAPATRARSRELARRARGMFTTAGPQATKELARLDTWLAGHR